MAATIKIKNSSTTGSVPSASNLVQGELAVNVTDLGLYTENASGTVVKLNAPSIDDKNTGATKHLTISTGGNLGLGVTPSAWSGFGKTMEFANAGCFVGSSGASVIQLGANTYYNGSNYTYATSSYATRYSQSSGAHNWYTAASGTAGNAITFTQAMTLDASGNLGVGTTSPSGRLHIATGGETTSRFDGSRGAADNLPVVTIPFWNVSNGVGDKQIATIGVLTGISSNQTQKGQIYFSTSDGTLTERARIDSSGNLLVGDTSGYLSSRVLVKTTTTDSSTNALTLRNSASTDLFRVRSDGYTYAGFYAQTTGSAANVFIGAGGDLLRSTSSLKYKRDVQNATHGLTEVMALRPVTYKGKSEADGDNVFGGLIAEEVHAAGLTEFVQYAEDGSPDALAYGNMVSLCIKAIQEQQAIIETLTNRITALEQA